MATTTTNFGWDIPQSTDLVKDGATAIAALGQDIDTALVDLKGGTTGQVLAKASNTDLDYTWVAQDDSNAIQNAIVDAKGDLIAATAADTPARLAVGTNGQVLTADSTAATGLAWAAPASGYADNPVLNSALQVWQRGTSFTAGGDIYTADRWTSGRGASAAGLTLTRQVTGDTTNLPNIQYCARVQRDSGNTGTGVLKFYQSFETLNSIPYVGKTVTFSFYARAGANFSASSNNLEAYLLSGTGTDQSMVTGFTSQTTVAGSATSALTTTWQRFTFTGTVATNATQLGIRFYYTPTGTAGAADYFEITGIMVEVGSTASTFHTNQSTIEGELSICQRYFQKTYSQPTAPATTTSVGSINGTNSGTTLVIGLGRLPVVMRVEPTITLYSSATGTTGKIRSGGADVTASAADVGDNGIGYLSATGLTAGGNSTIHYTASAEL